MTGSKFKSLFKSRHGTKWVKHTSKELDCSKATCMRYAIMAKIPTEIESKVLAILTKQ